MSSHKAHVSYIGITGIVSPAESDAIAQNVAVHSTRKIMIGVLVSSKTLRGQPNQWPNRYPRTGDIPGIFTDNPATFNVIHYNTNEPDTLADQIMAVRKMAGPNLHGLQLNIAWPDPDILALIVQQNPDQQIILQLGQEAFRMAEGLTGRVISKLKQEYSGLVDHVLLDLSAGYGRPLDTAWARQQLQELNGADLGVGLGVAGGLSPTSLHLVEPLIKDFTDLSIDAEARLRDENDNLDLVLAENYLRTAFAMFGD